jgi:uncharacterized protein
MKRFFGKLGIFALAAKVRNFVKGEVKDEEDALKGARDILAEQISEDERSRNLMRNQFQRQALIQSKVVKGKEAEEASAKYRDYFDFCEPLKKCSSHRLLALRRGESEGVLKVSIFPEDEDMCNERLQRLFVRANNECAHQVKEALTDAYKRLLKPAIETEFAALSKEKADEEAIRVFAENLRQLLLAPPLGQKRVMGIDPGFRTGCKVVCQLFCLCFFFHCFCKHQILHTVSGHKNLLKTGHMIGIRMTDKPVRNL